jgi:hypothetical protein
VERAGERGEAVPSAFLVVAPPSALGEEGVEALPPPMDWECSERASESSSPATRLI